MSYFYAGNSNLWHDRDILIVMGLKRVKKFIFNLLEEHKKHENICSGKVRGKNEIYDFSLLISFSPYEGVVIFIDKYKQVTPHSTGNRT